MRIPVPLTAVHSSEYNDLVRAVVDFVNRMLAAQYRAPELPVEALRSYYVDYYLAQYLNGGLSQFVYNSRWDDDIVRFVRDGLAEMGAARHSSLFAALEVSVSALGPNLVAYFESGYFGGNPTRDGLNELIGEFRSAEATGGLLALNHSYLLHSAPLLPLAPALYEASIQALCDAVPDKVARQQAALASESPEDQAIRRLCAAAGQALVQFNSWSEGTYLGQAVGRFHITTNEGHHYVTFLEGRALLFDGATHTLVAEGAAFYDGAGVKR